MKKYKIIVLGAHYSTMLGVVRSFGVAGHKIDAVFVGTYGAEIVRNSKYVQTFHQVNSRDDVAIVQLLVSNYSENTVLVPSDDYTSSLIDRYRNTLRPKFLMPFVEGHEQGAITHFMDKSVQSSLAEDAGLNVAKTWTVLLNGCELAIPDDMVYPCFVKPCISAERGKFGMCKCDNENELSVALNKLKEDGANSKVLVQEYLNIADEIQLTGICFGAKVYLPAIIKRLKVAEKSKGCTLYGEVKKHDEIGEQYPLIVSMLEKIHYTGLIVVDLIEANGKLYFSELNFRSSGVLYAMTMAGINLPEKFLKLLIEPFNESVFQDNISWGMRFLNDKVLWEDKKAGYISKADYKQMAESTSYYIIKDDADQGPYRAFMKNINPSLFRRALSKIKRIVHRRFINC